jgi:hypothetical protein
MLMISAGSFHMTQSMTSNLPGLDDVIKNNPQLMAKLQSNINKSISGPSELDKKKELYENVRKLHQEKTQNQNKPMQAQNQNKPMQAQNQNQNQNQNKPMQAQNQNQNQNKPMQAQNQNQNKPMQAQNQNKPISVKSLLQDIKSSIPNNSAADTNSITMGDTIYSDTDSSVNKPSVSNSVKTKSRLANKKNIQFSNT